MPPLWLIGLLAWLLGSIGFSLGMARWFRFLRDPETPPEEPLAETPHSRLQATDVARSHL